MSQLGQLDRLPLKASEYLLNAPDSEQKKEIERRCRAVLEHRGPESSVEKNYGLVLEFIKRNKFSTEPVVRYLLDYIASAKNLKLSWSRLAKKDKTTPGPDQQYYELYDKSAVWNSMRELGRSILSTEYSRRRERISMQKKSSGKGERPITIMSIFDRVVDKSGASILGKYCELFFQPCSFGYREGIGQFDALGTAYSHFEQRALQAWVCVDLRDAFLRVPISHFLEIFRFYFPDDRLVEFVEVLLGGSLMPGLRQGSPISPLLLNLYLHHHLDRKMTRNTARRMIRWADDILVLCQDPDDAQEAYQELVRVMSSIGMIIKESEEQAIIDMSKNNRVAWMGFDIEGYQANGSKSRSIRANISDTAWERLRENLTKLHSQPSPPLIVDASIHGWLSQYAPALRREKQRDIFERVKEIANDCCFDELDEFDTWQETIKAHRSRWLKKLKQIKTLHKRSK